MILGARVLAEFADYLDRYRDARPARITPGWPRPPGHLARHAPNRRLAVALYQQGFPALNSSSGACAYYGATAPAVTPATKPYAPWPTGSSESSRLPAPSHPHDETHAWAAHTATVA